MCDTEANLGINMAISEFCQLPLDWVGSFLVKVGFRDTSGSSHNGERQHDMFADSLTSIECRQTLTDSRVSTSLSRF